MKRIRASLLVLALSVSAYAGDMDNGKTATATSARSTPSSIVPALDIALALLRNVLAVV